MDSTTAILTLALMAALATTLAIHRKLRRTREKARHIVAAYSTFNPTEGMQSAIDAVAEYVRSTGAKVYNSFLISKEKNMLVSKNNATSITLTEKSSPVKAFYTMTPRALDPKYDTDKKLIELYGNKAWLIPIAQSPKRPCWKEHGCNNNLCVCHSTGHRNCWLESGKDHHSSRIQTYKDKERKCLRCISFLPAALLIGHGNSMQELATETNTAFGPLIKTVNYSNALADQAATDPLTGATSQAELLQRLTAIYPVCRHHSIPLSAYAFEIDNPKGIADHYGIPILQAMVQQTVRLATSTLGQADFCGRMSIDTTIYVMVLPNTEKAKAIEHAEQLRESVIQAKYQHTDKSGTERSALVRISAGVSEILTDDSEGPTELIKDAHTALYNAKAHKNKVLPFTHQLARPTEKKSGQGKRNPDDNKKKSATLRDILKE